MYSFHEAMWEDFPDKTGVDSFSATTFLTLPTRSIKLLDLAKYPTKSLLQSSYSNSAI